ncbi:acetyltransferase, GNAT family [Gottschalkia acidurici 9a]|uniref:Acetyltransferase, GNAT family n=1 Tax=Gottschalkia acidurici (strain ATCC 7906 / DSM 604 / BCRC 14475 / CIP 104303 / KCTC 5404 / NCIMB 10678 / 9a) TaxID=1128398 RepID=K0B052_GOTA9|nr:N-acetyltransferase [Gottschalkia acidurici]AFS78889.1 acetyltransferase, GNAT family [Gottschalkia acidurici 9a]
MITKLEIDDLEKVMKIWLETNINAHKFINEEYWNKNYDIVKEMLPQADILVYKSMDKIKGFIGISDNQYIAGLFVAKEYQGKGIGQMLLEEAKSHYSTLSLDVYSKNTKAINFYNKNGFTITKEQTSSDTGEVEYRMVWEKASSLK